MATQMKNRTIERQTGGYQQVKEYIASRYRVGDRLPNENDLARKLGLSRYAINRGLRELTTEGKVQREQGRGTFVTGRLQAKAGVGLRIAAFLADEFESFMPMEIVRGVEEYVRNKRISVALMNCNFDPSVEKQHLQEILDNGYAGAIVLLSEHPDSIEKARYILEQGIPLVQVDRHNDRLDCPWVETDDEQSAYKATRYLIDLGHRRIAHITFGQETSRRIGPVLERERGYLSAMKEENYTVPEEYIQRTTLLGPDQIPTRQVMHLMAYEPTHKLLSLPEPPTALFLVNDCFAPGALRAIQNHGMRVPHDISLIGFGDGPIAEHLAVPLTTVTQPFRKIGRMASQILESMIDGKGWAESPGYRLPAQLMIRSSTTNMAG